MIGIIVVTHGQLGNELIKVAASILEKTPENVIPISIDLSISNDKLRKKIADGIKKVDQRAGVLLLTDMFGGSPSNISYSFLEEGRVEVLSGVNLPVLVKAVKVRDNMSIGELALAVEQFGKKSISLASGILKGNKRS